MDEQTHTVTHKNTYTVYEICHTQTDHSPDPDTEQDQYVPQVDLYSTSQKFGHTYSFKDFYLYYFTIYYIVE